MAPMSQDRITAIYPKIQQQSEKVPPTLEPSIPTQQSTLTENWRVVKGQYLFLGDDAELEAELEAPSHELPSLDYLRDFVPKPLRGPEVLVLDPDRLLWTLYCQRVSAGNLIVPYYICELPVVVMLPTSPILRPRLRKDPMRGVRLDIDKRLYLRDVEKLWHIFPFATGICIWTNGHMQVLAPGLSESELSRLRLPAQVAGLNVSVSRASLIPTATEARHRPDLAYPRVRIGQIESIAALPLKGRDGRYPGQTFVSASTHAVLQGSTGKSLPMNCVPQKRENLKKFLWNIPSKERAGTVLAGIEVSDERGNVIGGTVDELIYDEHPIPSDALFPDAMRHDLCLVGLRPESSANFVQPCLPKLSWFPDHHLPSGSNIAILHDDDNSDGKTFKSGIFVQKPIKVNRPNGRVALLTSEVVDSAILYRRHAKPLKTTPNGMSGAAVVTTSYDREKGKHVYNKVAGFQSFQFVPPAAEGRPEDTSDDTSLEEDIKHGEPLNCCICVARPIPERLRSDMEIINDDTGMNEADKGNKMEGAG